MKINFAIIIGLLGIIAFSFAFQIKKNYQRSKYEITPICIGEICLGDKLSKLHESPNFKFRYDEFEYSMSNYIDSVLFIENHDNNEVLAYSRISLSVLNENSKITMVITESDKVQTSTGIKVGMTFNELKKLIPSLELDKEPWDYLRKGQFLAWTEISETENSLIVINYGEVESGTKLDSLVTSISIHLENK